VVVLPPVHFLTIDALSCGVACIAVGVLGICVLVMLRSTRT
jgi:hypothetical protein